MPGDAALYRTGTRAAVTVNQAGPGASATAATEDLPRCQSGPGTASGGTKPLSGPCVYGIPTRRDPWLSARAFFSAEVRRLG